MNGLKPFWAYYGGKWRAAPRYPKPIHSTIIEPFAGAAGYAMRYPDREVILVEKYPIVAEIWRYLIGASSAEILRIPLVESVCDLPSGTPEGGRYLVGFCLNAATASPCCVLSSGARFLRAAGRTIVGWSEERRSRVAQQVNSIKHWRIIEGDFSAAPKVEATWFIDPPYNNSAGKSYVHHEIDYSVLGDWCANLSGQVIVCENEGAVWLPFQPFATLKAGVNGKGSKEVLWHRPFDFCP